LAVVVSVGVVRLSVKVMVCPATVLLNTTLVPAVTAAAKVAPLLCANVSVLRGLLLPTVPDTNTTPCVPARIVTACALGAMPFKVLPKVIFAPLAKLPLSVVSKVVLTDTTASSAITMELGLLVRTKPPPNELLPFALVSKCAGAVIDPMAPV